MVSIKQQEAHFIQMQKKHEIRVKTEEDVTVTNYVETSF